MIEDVPVLAELFEDGCFAVYIGDLVLEFRDIGEVEKFATSLLEFVESV